jgi:hypothetical protein
MATRKSPKTSLNLRKALGASEETSQQLLSLYIPDKDSEGREFGANQGEVVVEFDGRFYRITKFDAA